MAKLCIEFSRRLSAGFSDLTYIADDDFFGSLSDLVPNKITFSTNSTCLYACLWVSYVEYLADISYFCDID